MTQSSLFGPVCLAGIFLLNIHWIFILFILFLLYQILKLFVLWWLILLILVLKNLVFDLNWLDPFVDCGLGLCLRCQRIAYQNLLLLLFSLFLLPILVIFFILFTYFLHLLHITHIRILIWRQWFLSVRQNLRSGREKLALDLGRLLLGVQDW